MVQFIAGEDDGQDDGIYGKEFRGFLRWGGGMIIIIPFLVGVYYWVS
ncbi:hypothetical protein [Nocardiopsis chromatogenes]|nr:hypothetical protein [Nocardiopsis chromatogenes]